MIGEMLWGKITIDPSRNVSVMSQAEFRTGTINSNTLEDET